MLGDYRTIIRSRPCHVIVLLQPVAQAQLVERLGRRIGRHLRPPAHDAPAEYVAFEMHAALEPRGEQTCDR
jgi:hypothetical protein